MSTTVKKISFDGLEVAVFRDSDDDRICVAIYSDDLKEHDTLGKDRIPRIRLIVNDYSAILDSAGDWVEDKPKTPLDLLAEAAE